FDHAIKNSHDYDAAIREKTAAGLSGEELFFELALEDLTRAADLFRPIHEATNGVDGWVSLEGGGDLERDPAVDTVRRLVDGPEEIGGAGQILERELEEELLAGEPRRGLLADGRVVVVAVLDRVVEDRRVRGEPRDRQLLHVPGERPAGEEGARDVVEPEALARVVQPLRRLHRVPFCRAASSSA